MIHRLSHKHRHNQALAAHYLRRSWEFEQKALDGIGPNADFWWIATGRQLDGALEALAKCGCSAADWTLEVRELVEKTGATA